MMNAAQKAKKDEFYTQRADIENELRHYKPHFVGKVVYCNCDDPYESWFFKYFAMNFNALSLKKLIATIAAVAAILGAAAFRKSSFTPWLLTAEMGKAPRIRLSSIVLSRIITATAPWTTTM